MVARIVLSESGSPGEQIADQIRGLIATGQLLPGDRLASVRQLASDLGITPGTVAKVYRELEADGIVVTRIGSGTRVSEHAGGASAQVLRTARKFAEEATASHLALEEAIQILGAVWPTSDD